MNDEEKYMDNLCKVNTYFPLGSLSCVEQRLMNLYAVCDFNNKRRLISVFKDVFDDILDLYNAWNKRRSGQF